MAHIDKNIVTVGLSGSLGRRVVFRKAIDGGTVLATRPKFSKTPSEMQKSHREKFQVAVMYAKAVISNPELKAAYKAASKPGVSAFAYALADFLKPPTIREVDLKEYTGEPGSKISILAIDNFRLREVRVVITDGEGKEIETGTAEKNSEGLDWIYTATAANSSLKGSRVGVTATDTPRHTVNVVSTV